MGLRADSKPSPTSFGHQRSTRYNPCVGDSKETDLPLWHWEPSEHAVGGAVGRWDSPGQWQTGNNAEEEPQNCPSSTGALGAAPSFPSSQEAAAEVVNEKTVRKNWRQAVLMSSLRLSPL